MQISLQIHKRKIYVGIYIQICIKYMISTRLRYKHVKHRNMHGQTQNVLHRENNLKTQRLEQTRVRDRYNVIHIEKETQTQTNRHVHTHKDKAKQAKGQTHTSHKGYKRSTWKISQISSVLGHKEVHRHRNVLKQL